TGKDLPKALDGGMVGDAGWRVVAVEPAVDETAEGLGRQLELGVDGRPPTLERDTLARHRDGEVLARLRCVDRYGRGLAGRLGGIAGDELQVVHDERRDLGGNDRSRVERDLDVPRVERMLVEAHPHERG